MIDKLIILISLVIFTLGANSLRLANSNEKAEMLTAFCSKTNEQNIRANVMKRINYLSGQKINGVVYIKDVAPYTRKNGTQDRKALFQCKCGNQFESVISIVKKGNTQSCGCLHSRISSERLTQHGFSQTAIYKVWKNMRSRCYNPKHKSFKDYGGRGIKVCDEWINNPSVFVNWAISNGYKKGLQLDRINNDGNYEPNNCRFVTPKVNTRNRRNTKIGFSDIREINLLKKQNPKLTTVEIAERYRVNPATIRKILSRKAVV